ncbi:MAG TPA: DinB family protein, partial [Vicinamibacterales bacterium]|nr:DinB family protein [Vicinamibacterales bacterium]
MAPFTLSDSYVVLGRTPAMLRLWLDGLPEPWVRDNEGPDTWSPYDVVGHLIHGEQTDWMPRVRQIVDGRGHEPFTPFDRFAMQRRDQTRPLTALLDEFAALRAANLKALQSLGL